jgi:CheY-like chemotaxis protein
MKTILFLDDMAARHDVFGRSYNKVIGEPCKITCVDTADSCIEKLQQDFDYVFLDHDLEFAHYGKTSDSHKDGRFVCREIVRLNLNEKALYFIHSMNPDGRKEMAKILKDSGRNVVELPFICLI